MFNLKSNIGKFPFLSTYFNFITNDSETGLYFSMSSFDNEDFFNSVVISDSLENTLFRRHVNYIGNRDQQYIHT